MAFTKAFKRSALRNRVCTPTELMYATGIPFRTLRAWITRLKLSKKQGAYLRPWQVEKLLRAYHADRGARMAKKPNVDSGAD